MVVALTKRGRQRIRKPSTRQSGAQLPVPDQYTEMNAVSGDDPPAVHVARVDDLEPDAEYRCACLLAQTVRIDLEDG